jgi:hypothetical protein
MSFFDSDHQAHYESVIYFFGGRFGDVEVAEARQYDFLKIFFEPRDIARG